MEGRIAMRKNREIEQKIKSAFLNALPDNPEQLQRILSQCDKGDGFMEQRITMKKRMPRWAKWTAAAAAVIIIGTGALLGTRYYLGNMTVNSEIILDVNPSIEIQLNSKEKVMDVKAQNQDAIEILDGMDLKGTDLNVTVNALLGSLVKHGYIDDLSNSILVTVENDNAERGAQIQSEIVAEIDRILSSQSINGSVLGQNFSMSADPELQSIANQYQISLGKAALVQTLVKNNPLYSAEELSKLSINELNLLLEAQGTTQQNSGISSTGAASDKAYIGQDSAKAAALTHAGLSEADVTFEKIKLDYDDGVVEYDVDFYTSTTEYNYEINALTGTVISFESEQHRSNGSSGITSSPSGNSQIEQAKQTALSHAGVDASQATFKKAELDYDNGRQTVEIEFYTSNMKYEYEIDVATQGILSCDYESFSVSPSGGGASINEDQARQIAQNKAPNARITSFEVDRDNGQVIYEIELREGNIEYDCEIRQSDGQVLKWEQSYDD